ncbi:hypothetical protein Dimus_009982 [Dionaea muscipula]
MGDAGASGPTGCYKCGRPGHWSRDCPSSASASTATATDPNPNPTFNPKSSDFTSTYQPRSFSAVKPFGKTSGAAQKPKKVPRTRPKLTPERLLSNDGLGYILRYFPRNFKYRGRGHEVSDLRNLLRMYTEWHAHLLPYHSFDQFVHKVEQVGSTKLVRSCLQGLREKVAKGGDPTKWDETSVEETPQNMEDPMHSEDRRQDMSSPKGSNADQEMQEGILNEIYHQTVQNVQKNTSSGQELLKDTTAAEAPAVGIPSRNSIQINDDQKARMEANRLKALERANAKARLLPATT